MRDISAWGHLMSSTVTVASLSGEDGYAKPSYGSAVTYRAHLSYSAKMIYGSNGQQQLANISAHLMTNAAILPTAQVTLSTADVGSTETNMINPRIVSVERRNDSAGPNFTVLHLAQG